MAKEAALNLHLRPMRKGGRGLILLATLLGVATACWFYYVARLFSEGHALFGTSSYGGVWGITVVNIVHIIGISHVGIAVSATVRLLQLKRYRNVARLAEVLTLVSLMAAVLNIAIDVGRPDRFITSILIDGVWHAPMVWSMTVISLYLMASTAYMYLSLRRDLWRMSHISLRFRRFYSFLSLGYRDTMPERQRQEKILRWLAIALLPIMVAVHSVYGLLFGLLAAKVGWYNPLQGPYFVLAAIVSGFSAIIVVAALLRWAYSWKSLLPDTIFKVLGSFLAFVIFLYLYFIFSEHLTAQFAHLPAEKELSSSLLYGEFSGLFWLTMACGLLLPMVYLFVQGVSGRFVNVGLTAVTALTVNIALWVKRVLLVVPPQFQSHLPMPRPPVEYRPTLEEMFVTAGTYAVAGLVFLALLKWVPMIELPDEVTSSPGSEHRSRIRAPIALFTLTAGVLLISWSIWSREMAFAPLKWVLGLALLVLIPLEWCLIADRTKKARPRRI